MSVKSKVRSLQKSINDLQFFINDLDEKLSFYNVLIPNLTTNPFQIKFFRRGTDNSHTLIATASVNLLDEYLESNNLDSKLLEQELDYLKKNNSSKMQIDELVYLKRIFGI